LLVLHDFGLQAQNYLLESVAVRRRGDVVGRKTLTSKEAAQVLGVSEASVKRWADGGLLPSAKTAGGHRRFRPEDVAEFRRAKLGHAAPRPHSFVAPRALRAEEETALTRAAGDDTATGASIFDALVAGDIETASALVVRTYLRGLTVGSVADFSLCPAMRRVGDLWHAGQLTVAQEHVATRTALGALAALRASMELARPTGLTAICCSVEEDFHELPVHLSSVVLEARGWETVVLGASTPFYALAESVGRFAPRLVCVSATVMNNPDRAAREYAEFREAAARASAAVVLGGAGFEGDALRRRFPAELHADSFAQLETLAAALAAEGDEGDKL
jgi:MerR family transcriptional regulator, light-induced transcriptional regulator